MTKLTKILCATLFVASIVLGQTTTVLAQGRARPKIVEVGRQLFEHEWKPGQPAAPGGDGLGPVHNDVSCVACHFQGGIGGGGPLHKNVDIIAPGLKSPMLSNRQAARRLGEFHPEFMTKDGVRSAIHFHRFSTDPTYERERLQLVGYVRPLLPSETEAGVMQRQVSVEPIQQFATPLGFALKRAERNTTAIFGASLIDEISDRTIRNLAAEQKRKAPAIAGRISPIGSAAQAGGPRVGRFGWRGQMAHLHDFVVGACSAELGLHTPEMPQEKHPSHYFYEPDGYDMTAEQVRAMTVFCASLPAPKQVMPSDPELAKRIKQGHSLFHQIGCAACHVENVGKAKGIFSDLLLHDMGSGLSDPLPASHATRLRRTNNPDIAIKGVSTLRPAMPKYYANQQGRPAASASTPARVFDGVTEEPILSPVESEWQTPPLWGIADSAPYMHDGRASSLVEAIAYHGGQGSASMELYFGLTLNDQLKVIEFLKTLHSPRTKK